MLALAQQDGLVGIERVRDENMERASLAAFLRGAAADEATLPPEAYAHPDHRLIYECLQSAAKRYGAKAVDVVAVRSELVLRGASREVIEYAELLPLQDADPKALHTYLTSVRELHTRRSAMQLMASAVYELAKPGASYAAVSAKVVRALSAQVIQGVEGRGGDDVRSLIDDIVRVIEERESGAPETHAYLPTPFPGLSGVDAHGNHLLEVRNPMRGFPCRKGASALGVIAARSGTGKTALLATLLHYWICVRGLKAGLVGLEDGTRWLIERWAARDLRLDWGSIGTQPPREQDVAYPAQSPWIPEAVHQNRPVDIATLLNFYEEVLDQRMRRYSGATIASPQLAAMVRRWIEDGAQVVVVDHGLRVDYSPGQNERMDLAIKRGISTLTQITIETGVPIILAWHLNRCGEDAAAPTMNDIKESGYLDSEAALILGAWRQGATGRTLLNVIKSRKSGGIGQVVELAWAGESGMFNTEQCGPVDLAAENAATRGKGKGL